MLFVNIPVFTLHKMADMVRTRRSSFHGFAFLWLIASRYLSGLNLSDLFTPDSNGTPLTRHDEFLQA